MKARYSLDNLRLFWMVTKKGNFTKAATALGMPVSTLSRRVSQLEDELQMRLLNRDARRVTLTSSGLKYMELCGPLLDKLQALDEVLQEDKQSASGKIRISAPTNLTQHKLSHLFNTFLHQHPNIQIELSLSNKNIDIEGERIDVAFRASELKPMEWITRSLGAVDSIVCKSGNLDIDESLTHPSQLNNYPLIISNPIKKWELINSKSKSRFEVTPGDNVRLEADELNVVAQAVIDGVGVGFIPRFVAEPLIRNGSLVQVLPQWSGYPKTLYILYRERQNQPYRLRLFIDFIMQNQQLIQ